MSKRYHIRLEDDVAELLEQLRLRDGERWPRSLVVSACIREMAKKRGFMDD